MFAVRGIGQSREIALVEAEAFGGTAQEKDAFGEECEGSQGEDEWGGSELDFLGREEPEGSSDDGEHEVEGGAAGMVFEVAGKIFEKEFAERHAKSVAQNSGLSSGAEAQFYLRLTWRLKPPPPKEKGKGARDGPRPLHRPTLEKQRRPAEADRYVLTCSRTRAGAACRALTWKEKQVPRAKTALGMTIF